MVKTICEEAKTGWYDLVALDTPTLNRALVIMAHHLLEASQDILQANALDMENARASDMSQVMLDRLLLTPTRIKALADSLVTLSDLPSPRDQEPQVSSLYNGLELTKMVVPFGLVAMIYESRPNVTVDAAAIALKTGNAIVLKGGKEAIETNRKLVEVMHRALAQTPVPPACIGFIDTVDRQASFDLLNMKGLVDLLIPRGSAGLINWVTQNAKVPVIETGAGNCHLYIDKDYDKDLALKVIENAKVQRPSVCNALEKVLIHHEVVDDFAKALYDHLGDRVAFKVDTRVQQIIQNASIMTPQEYGSEYLDYILGVRAVKDIKEAVQWINAYGTHHSDGIITKDDQAAAYFKTVVDSAVVYHNASTRFTDGGEFGFGAEIGIATSKVHARGPMGLEAMTTYKYLVKGQGQIRE